jgi:hypothetical protein
MAEADESLTATQQLAITALLEERTLKAAAAACGVDERTLRRWLQSADFAEAFRTARGQVYKVAIARLQRLASRAVSALAKGLKAPRPADAIRAADLLLQHGRAALELEDLVARVEALEGQRP